jgi:hypothetical protein
VTSAYAELLDRARADPGVLGLILSGSQARGAATAHSDFDVYVIVPDRDGSWVRERNTEVDIAVLTLADLGDVSDRWQRYSYRGAVVLLDRLGGRIAELVERQATLTPAESAAMVPEELDGYLNFIYRAAKSRRDGHPDLARLDELEAGPWFLWTLFALYGRVRPYNKFLRWELDTYPLPAPWTAGHLIPALADRPSRLFAELEPVVRAKGFGAVIDSWDDLDVVR